MKKLITTTLIAIVISLSVNAQNKKDTLPALTDTLKFISLADLNRLAEPLKSQVSALAFENWKDVTQRIINEAIKEYQQKLAAQKPKTPTTK